MGVWLVTFDMADPCRSRGLNRNSLLQTWVILLMDKILHDLKDSKLWELRYIPYNG